MSAHPRQPPLPETLAQDERDGQLAALLERLADQMRCQGQADVDALAREHPALAGELRSLWQTVVLAGCLGPADAAGAQDAAAALAVPLISAPMLAAAPNGNTASWGDYELLAELGRGGMGVVYKARHRQLGRIVALKIMRQDASAPSVELLRFRQEAIAAARLEHPSVVPVYEVGEYQGRPFFTMQYVAGTTLAERLADGPLAPREAASLLLPVCEAIQAAHQQGVLHRDLKPANILIDTGGRPLVTDFGLAKQVTADNYLTQSGAILGTPTHLAPEQAAGSRGNIGPATDVYSLGVILYQLLTGRPPFQGATPMDTVLMVLEQEPVPPRLLNPKADRSLEMIALKCLQKPADLRYASAQALADDLRAWLADEPIAARSGLFSQVVARWMGETHHAPVLQNWGLLWMWHSLALLVLCFVTNALQWRGVASPVPYLLVWVAGLGTWAMIFWTLRRRSGPVTFVERQIAHIWAGSVISIALLFPVEQILGVPVLTLSPVLGLTSGCVFLVKAGMLSGAFYVQATALFATALAMALLERWQIPLSISLFGVVSAACFFFPGWRYWRQRRALDNSDSPLPSRERRWG